MNNNQGMIKKSHPAYTFSLISLIFVIPMIIAVALYYERETLGKTLNRGQLINPALPISELSIQQGTPASTQGRWLVFFINKGPCEQTCQHTLFNLRQIRLATGKNSARLSPAILTFQENHFPHPQLEKLLSHQFPEMLHLTANQKHFNQIINQRVRARYATHSGATFIVDPLGNVIMAYKPNAAPSTIYKDLSRLLKVSQIG